MSSDEIQSLELLVRSLPSLLAKRTAELDDREKQIEAERNQLETEKHKMGLDYKPSDVLELNVRGDTSLAVLRRTLTSVDGSMLAAKFSGRWDESLEKDGNGRFFINQPMELFKPMIDYLHCRECETPLGPPAKSPTLNSFPSREPPTSYQDFVRMVEYYGMTPGIFPTHILLNSGKQEDSTINSLNVDATEFSTFTLQPYGHDRRIKSFEVTLGDSVDVFQIGWIEKKSIGETDSIPNNIGIAEHDMSFALDLVRRKLQLREKGGSATTITLETEMSARKGTVVRCETFENSTSSSEWNINWYIDGERIEYEIPIHGLHSLGRYDFPAVSSKGQWSVTNVELSY